MAYVYNQATGKFYDGNGNVVPIEQISQQNADYTTINAPVREPTPAPQAAPASAVPTYIQREDPRTGMSITTPNPASPEGARLIDQQWALAGVAAGERPLTPMTPAFNDPYAVENSFKPTGNSPAEQNLRDQLSQAVANREAVRATWTPPEAPSTDMNSREKINKKLGSLSGMGSLQLDSMKEHLQIGGPLDPMNRGIMLKGPTEYAVKAGGNIQYGDPYSRAIGIGLNTAAIFGSAPAIYANTDVSKLAGIEIMRQQKAMAGDTKGSQFYGGELAANIKGFTDLSDAYHAAGMKSGKPAPANPFEYRGDLAVEFLKGAPRRDTEKFSPVSGEMGGFLPQINGRGLGLQEWSWKAALNTDKPGKYGAAPAVSFMAAIQKLGRSGSEYGPYGALAGAGTRKERTLADVQADIQSQIGRSQPSIKSMAPESMIWERAPAAGPKNPPGTPAPGSSWVDNAIGMLKGPILIGNAGGFGAQAADQGYVNSVVVPASLMPKDQPKTLFEDTASWFKNAPILGGFYNAGAGMSSKNVNDLNKFITSAPILENIRKGGQVFGLKSEYERTADRTNKDLAPMFDTYNAELSRYDADMKAYNLNMTDAGYNNLKSQQGVLDSRKKTIDQMIGRVDAAKSDYEKAAGNLTGNLDQKGFLTYGAGMFVGDLGKGYEDIIEAPMQRFNAAGNPVGQFAFGLVDVPRQLATMGQSALIGGENIIRSLPNAPGLATAGLAMQGKGMYEQAIGNPAGLAGSLVGMYALGALVSKGTNIARGEIRTRGMDNYVPIKSIGYDAKYGYPIKPPGASAADLTRSFEEGVLYPKATQMSATRATGLQFPKLNDISLKEWATTNKPLFKEGIFGSERVAPPYLHGKDGIPAARMAGQEGKVLYTAHESPSLINKGIIKGLRKVGEEYTMEGSGSSELASISAAPVLESYFNKVGGQISRFIGVDTIFKAPTSYATDVSVLEAVPKGTATPAEIAAKNYAAIDRYMQARSAKTPGVGKAYLPMIKGEYEANIPTGSKFEITGMNKYTKIGGFGENHFLGTKVPIVEQKLVGFEPPKTTGIPTEKQMYSSYKPGPLVNLKLATVTSALYRSNQPVLLSPSKSRAGASPKYTGPGSRSSVFDQSSDQPQSSQRPRGYLSGFEYPSLSSRPSKSSSALTSALSLGSIISLPSNPTSPKESPVYSPPKYTPPYSPPATPKYSPPKSPGYSNPYSPKTPGYTPPYSPRPPTTPPITPFLPLSYPTPSGSGFSPMQQRSFGRFTERLSFVYPLSSVRSGSMRERSFADVLGKIPSGKPRAARPAARKAPARSKAPARKAAAPKKSAPKRKSRK